MTSSLSMWNNNLLMTMAGLPEQTLPASTLYVVGLPIGNLGDITLRGLWVLSRADAVAAEDTRETRKLLDKFGIHTHLISVREHNERSGAELIISKLSVGERVALVTDAGTPAISDPGAHAVGIIREAGYNVVPVPGASAVVTALSASGLKGTGFNFVGFVPPQSKARRSALARYAARPEPFVLYEAPHRICELLTDLASALEPEREVVVAREITKKFETFTKMSAKDLLVWIEAHEPRGEYVVLVDEAPVRAADLGETERRWLDALSEVLPASKAAAVAAKVTGLPRQSLYAMLGKKDES